jgi:hypothetical protein
MKQMDLFEARQARDEAVQRAGDHAEAVNPGWNEMAFQFLKSYILIHQGSFTTEDVRSYAAMADFPLPPDSRAWGGIMTRARLAGMIRPGGFTVAKNKVAHCRPQRQWITVKK